MCACVCAAHYVLEIFRCRISFLLRKIPPKIGQSVFASVFVCVFVCDVYTHTHAHTVSVIHTYTIHVYIDVFVCGTCARVDDGDDDNDAEGCC